MNSKLVATLPLMILFSAGTIIGSRSTGNDVAVTRTVSSFFHSKNAPLEDTLTKVVLEGSGYSVMMPVGYYMSRVPFEGYVPKPNDGNLDYYFFPVVPDTVCGTRLLIVFDRTPLPKTGYVKGSEFRI